MSSKGKFYMTTAIAYTSGKPHIGNTYEIVLADAIARFRRQEGYDVYFQTGTDEHGQKIQEKAEKAGITPKEYVDNVAGEVKRIWDLMNTSYDNFVRTTDEDHEKQVKKIFKKLYDKGDIYKGSYEGLYCTPCESFWTESQLVDGKCPDCGREVQPAKEEAYFFKMSKYADKLIDYINEHPEFIQPVSRKNEMMNNFLLPGLQDLCVSRTSFSWGIPVDFDPKHVVYVWLDALTNYITKIGYDADGNSSELFNKNWPADLHLIGKDIIRFHTIYWPIFLMALDLPLPKQVFGHPWLLQGGEKMSKSRGNVVNPDDIVAEFGADTLRTYEMFIGAFDLSASWSQEGVKGCRRFLERVWKLQDSLVDGDSYSKELESKMHQTIKKVSSDYESLKYNTAIAAMMTLVNEFYKAGKVTGKEFETLLILLNPVAPHMTEELWADLGYEGRLYQTAWPEFDEEKTVEAVAEIAVQINGKMRGTIKIAKDADKETAIAAAKEAVADKLTGNIVKEIYVPGRIVNIVQK